MLLYVELIILKCYTHFMKKPQISLVIAIYNLEKYLRECMDSVLNQTFQDFEVICVNDGSTDGTLEILNEYADKDHRIKIINQQNQGAGAARTRGLREVQGKYFQMLDGDDYFEPNMLEKLYNLAEKHGADIAACSSRKVDDFGNITESRNPNSPIDLWKTPLNKPFSYKDFPEDIFSLIGYVPWNKLYLTSMAKENSLEYPSIVGGEDMAFVLMALACAKKVVVIDDELINYRFNRPGSVYTYRANHASDMVRTAGLVKDFLEKKGLYQELKISHKNAFTTAIRWELSHCSPEQYEKFLSEVKNIQGWKEFEQACKKLTITPEFLNSFIGNKKVFLWGASNYIKDVLSRQKTVNSNILGIIDGNKASWGSNVYGYEIFSEDILKENKADAILMTVFNNHEAIYPQLKELIEQKYSGLELLPDIFKS